jgi:hypothetical protein
MTFATRTLGVDPLIEMEGFVFLGRKKEIREYLN